MFTIRARTTSVSSGYIKLRRLYLERNFSLVLGTLRITLFALPCSCLISSFGWANSTRSGRKYNLRFVWSFFNAYFSQTCNYVHLLLLSPTNLMAKYSKSFAHLATKSLARKISRKWTPDFRQEWRDGIKAKRVKEPSSLQLEKKKSEQSLLARMRVTHGKEKDCWAIDCLGTFDGPRPKVLTVFTLALPPCLLTWLAPMSSKKLKPSLQSDSWESKDKVSWQKEQNSKLAASQCRHQSIKAEIQRGCIFWSLYICFTKSWHFLEKETICYPRTTCDTFRLVVVSLAYSAENIVITTTENCLPKKDSAMCVKL